VKDTDIKFNIDHPMKDLKSSITSPERQIYQKHSALIQMCSTAKRRSTSRSNRESSAKPKKGRAISNLDYFSP